MQSPFVIIAVAIALIIILVKSKAKVEQIRNYLLVATIVSSVVLYCIGYAATPIITNEAPVGIFIRATQSTARLFVLMPDYNGVRDALLNPCYYVAFVTLNAMAVILFILATVSLFARRYYGWLRIVGRFCAESYIFININEESIVLAKDILRVNPKALIIFLGKRAEKGDLSLFDTIESFGGVYIEQHAVVNNPLQHWLLKQHAIRRKTHLLLMSESESKNITDAISLLDSFSEEEYTKAEKNVELYLRVNSQELIQSFNVYQNKSKRKLQYATFSDAELVAFDVLMEHPPVDQITIDTQNGAATENYEVMIVGFDKKGQAILRKMIEFGQFVGSTFKATS